MDARSTAKALGNSVWWNSVTRKTAAVPRHREVKNPTAHAICKALKIPKA